MLDLQYEQHEREQEEMQLTGQPVIAATSSYYHPSTAVANERNCGNYSINIDSSRYYKRLTSTAFGGSGRHGWSGSERSCYSQRGIRFQQ
jgi:hypothetical protein